VPFGDNASEDFVLGQTTAFGSGGAKSYKNSNQKKRQRDLMNYMAQMGREKQIVDASNQRLTYDPNVVDEKEVALVSMGRGQKPYNAVVSKQDPLNRDWNMLKDTATFAAKDPETFGDVLKLGLMQSPVKAVGRLGEATWARGNDNYQNDLSKQFYDSYMRKDTKNWREDRWRDPNQKTMTGEPLYPLGTDEAKTGSYDDMMRRNKEFQVHKEILGSMEPDFTSDFTPGDAADTVSWFIPGPGTLGKTVGAGVKAGAAVGKGVKGARTALAEAMVSGFGRDVSSGFKMGARTAAGMPFGTAGGGAGIGRSVRLGQSHNGFAVVKPEAALEELAKNEWTRGSTMDITSTGELLDNINYNGYGRRTDPRLTSPSDTNNINMDQLTPDEINNMSPETLDLLQNQPQLRQLDQQGTVSLRGSNEPVRARVQKYPTQAQFNKRLSGERLSGANKELKQQLYDEAITLIDESGGYWRVTDAESGKNIGGMDIAHRQHYAEGGKAVDTSGRPNVEVQGRGSNRFQGAKGVGGAEGFAKWWEANKNTASNRAILEALFYEVY